MRNAMITVFGYFSNRVIRSINMRGQLRSIQHYAIREQGVNSLIQWDEYDRFISLFYAKSFNWSDSSRPQFYIIRERSWSWSIHLHIVNILSMSVKSRNEKSCQVMKSHIKSYHGHFKQLRNLIKSRQHISLWSNHRILKSSQVRHRWLNSQQLSHIILENPQIKTLLDQCWRTWVYF